MKSRSQGTFVIPWSQTETDGLRAAPLGNLSVGASWCWTGSPVRVDGPQGVLVLTEAVGIEDLRKRAARMVRRLMGGLAMARPTQGAVAEPACPDQSFVVTDGHEAHVLTLLTVPGSGRLLVMAMGKLPPMDRDLWVVQVAIDHSRTTTGSPDTGGVICFTPGTWLATPDGPRRIDDLVQGDRVLTRDNGAQMVLWRGQRRMTGARLHAMPHLRPIRFRRGAMGDDRPEHDLLVSPQHRMLVKGAAAQALFNTPEVLIAAEHLVNDRNIMVDYTLREVTYIHILLRQHNVIWANGLETESFHPANAAMDPAQRNDLLGLVPDLVGYGDYARRTLSAAEAAILQYHMGAAGR